MTFRDWIGESRKRLHDEGLRAGVHESSREFYYGALRTIEQNIAATGLNPGTNFLDLEWDVLVIVDGCRYDLMAEVAPNYGFLSGPDKMTSVAGGSLGWMHRTFTAERDLTDLAYVTANPFSSRLINDRNFGILDEVWRYSWKEELGTVPAPEVTAAAIDTFRGTDFDRYIVHYMQPHHPFVPDPLAAGINRDNPVDHETTVWEKLRDDEVDRDTVWNAYRSNLEYVLDSVSDLRTNIDAAKIAVSSDHGNALGEGWIYGHGDYPLPALRIVPWCMTSGRDERTLEPVVDRSEVKDDVRSKLTELGYR